MAKLMLRTGHKIEFDDTDFVIINQYKWYASGGYAHTRDKDNKTLYMHRLILNAPKGYDVDHIDGNKLNNRRLNLRICTRSENASNRKGTSRRKSKYKGVFKATDGRKNPWTAQVQVNYKRVSLGYYSSEIEAAKAYNRGALKYFGKYAKLNVLED